jgi:K(+)-stimulated pyrophosphate-energized sodium pump
VGPSADGFETYGVTGVALISFIVLAVPDSGVQVQLLVWLFAMRVMMVITSVASYWINEAVATARYSNATTMNFEAPLTSQIWPYYQDRSCAFACYPAGGRRVWA